MILAGDIGGTHTRLALFEKGKIVQEQKFMSRSYPGLEQIAREFLRAQRAQVLRACFGVAGAVRNGRCHATNLPWIIDAAALSRALEIPSVHLLNDLEANAYGLKVLGPSELLLIQKGDLLQRGNQALIAAGTGLGEAGLYWDGHDHRPFACEGGHTDFAARNSLEQELFVYLKKKFGHVSYERIVSGPGLHSLYQFLIDTHREARNPDVEEQMKQKDPSSVISEWGMKGLDQACVHALDWFVSVYGAEAGNVALKFMSLGGLFIGGGIAPHILDKLKSGPFLPSFLDKGRFKPLLESMPIWIVLNDDAALLGAASYAGKS
jgi:glucokinase